MTGLKWLQKQRKSIKGLGLFSLSILWQRVNWWNLLVLMKSCECGSLYSMNLVNAIVMLKVSKSAENLLSVRPYICYKCKRTCFFCLKFCLMNAWNMKKGANPYFVQHQLWWMEEEFHHFVKPLDFFSFFQLISKTLASFTAIGPWILFSQMIWRQNFQCNETALNSFFPNDIKYSCFIYCNRALNSFFPNDIYQKFLLHSVQWNSFEFFFPNDIKDSEIIIQIVLIDLNSPQEFFKKRGFIHHII